MLALAAVALLAGCAASGPPAADPIPYDDALLSGARVFGEPVSSAEVPEVDMLAVTDDMGAFLDTWVTDRRLPSSRFKALFRGLAKNGYFEDSYTADRTLTAAEAFQAKNGNCLSYTNLFIALARQADLDAAFQIVDVPPSWDADSGILIRYSHINVRIKGVRIDTGNDTELSVDFNEVHPSPEYPRWEISDEYATALFYANLSVDHLRDGNSRKGFAYLRKALEMTPENVDLWLNLGAFYSMHDDVESSLEAYKVALKLDRRNKGAMAGLARAYERAGDPDRAEYYDQQVRNYRQSNAYYHFALAQAAYDSADYEAALDAINTAIDLKGRNSRFYFMKGLTQQKLGDEEAARKSFQRATRYGSFSDLKRRYIQDLAGVGSS